METTFFGPSLLLGYRGPRPPRPALMLPPPRLPLSVSLSRLWPVLSASQWTQPSGPHHDFGQRPSPRTGRYTSPQSRAVNVFSKETMASPYRPTWLHVMKRVQCIKAMFSCSCFNQRTHVLIKWLELNVAYAFPVYVKSFKGARFMHCSITCNFLLHSSSSSSNTLVSYLHKNQDFRSSAIKGMIFLH